MIEILLPDKADFSVPLQPSVVWFIEGTRTFVNGYTKDVTTNKVKINGELRGVYKEVFPAKAGRFPTNVLFDEAFLLGGNND